MNYTIPELPPGTEVDEALEVAVSIIDNSKDSLLIMLVDAGTKGARLRTGPPDKAIWTYDQYFSTMQDAIDAGVARLWLGLHKD